MGPGAAAPIPSTSSSKVDPPKERLQQGPSVRGQGPEVWEAACPSCSSASPGPWAPTSGSCGGCRSLILAPRVPLTLCQAVSWGPFHVQLSSLHEGGESIASDALPLELRPQRVPPVAALPPDAADAADAVLNVLLPGTLQSPSPQLHRWVRPQHPATSPRGGPVRLPGSRSVCSRGMPAPAGAGKPWRLKRTDLGRSAGAGAGNSRWCSARDRWAHPCSTQSELVRSGHSA